MTNTSEFNETKTILTAALQNQKLDTALINLLLTDDFINGLLELQKQEPADNKFISILRNFSNEQTLVTAQEFENELRSELNKDGYVKSVFQYINNSWIDIDFPGDVQQKSRSNSEYENAKRGISIADAALTAISKRFNIACSGFAGKALSELLAWQPDDYLGRYFGQMRLDKHFHGQFFTPIHVCEFMAAVAFGDGLPQGKPYVTVAEPACGSGAMIIGLIRHLQKQGMTDLGGKLAILATDIDSLCVNMAYLQLGILGLSVRITHGNSLTDEVWDAFDTPNLQINTCLGYFK